MAVSVCVFLIAAASGRNATLMNLDKYYDLNLTETFSYSLLHIKYFS